MPLLRRRAQLIAHARVVEVLADPAVEPRPRRDQRLVDDLDRRTTIGVDAREQARRDQPVDDRVGVRDPLAQLCPRQLLASRVDGDEVTEHVACDARLIVGQATKHFFGVATECTADTAHRVVGLAGQSPIRAIAELPQPCGRKRQQRERARSICDGVDHLVGERRVR